jgi:hypothetical protein
MSKRLTRLNSIGDVLTELCRVYRSAKSKRMEWSDAKSAAFILREIRAVLTDSDFEERLQAVEERYGIERRSNGSDTRLRS